MSFPTNWPKKHKIVSDYTKVGGTANLTDYTGLLTEANFTTEAFANAQGQEINENRFLNDSSLMGYWRMEQTEDTNTKLLLHFDGADAAAATIESTANRAVTFVGNAQLDTAQKKFGTASLLLDGTGDYLTVPDSADFDLGSGEFTIDCWFRTTDNTVDQNVLSHYTDGDNRWLCGFAGGYIFFNCRKTGANVQSYQTWTPSNNVWYHLAFIRTGNNIRLFVDGTQIGSDVDCTGMTLVNATSALYIGTSWNGAAGGSMKGWIDELRIVKGTAKWTANFTPPTASYKYGFEDYSANSYNLAPVAAPVVTTGLFGEAVDFEASSSQFATTSEALAPLMELTGSRTISAWFKPESFTAISALVAKRGTDYATAPGYLFYVDTSAKVHMTVDGLTTSTDVVSNVALVAANWYHLVGVYNGSTLRVFINGRLDNTAAATGTGASNNTWNFCIGADNQGTSNAPALFADGLLDDVAVLNRALSDDEVLEIYRGGADLRFTDDEEGTNIIPHEVVKFDTTNSLAEVWVKVPTLSYTAATTIYVWYGNTTIDSIGRELSTLNRLRSDANLQGYWKLEADGTDSSANGYNLTGTTRGAVTGKFGNGLDFELGSSDYITIADASCANLEITGAKTYSCWVKFESHTDNQYMMAKSNSAASALVGLRYSTTAGNGLGFVHVGSTTNDVINTAIHPINGIWYHLVGVFDPTNTKLKMFVNGVKTEVTASGTSTDTNGDFALGRLGSYTTGFYTDGVIDDAFVMNRALTDVEVAEIYGNGRGAWDIDNSFVMHLENNSLDSTYNVRSSTRNNILDIAGKVGTSADFNGTSSSIIIPYAGLPTLADTTSWTFECWFRRDNSTTAMQLFQNRDDGAGGKGWDLFVFESTASASQKNRVCLRVTDAAGAQTVATSTTELNDTNIHHVAVIWNTETNTVDILVDGALELDDSSYAKTFSGVAKDFDLGAFDTVYNTNWLNGILDEVRMSASVRSNGWTITNYNNQNSPSTFWIESSFSSSPSSSPSPSSSISSSVSASISSSISSSISASESSSISSSPSISSSISSSESSSESSSPSISSSISSSESSSISSSPSISSSESSSESSSISSSISSSESSSISASISSSESSSESSSPSIISSISSSISSSVSSSPSSSPSVSSSISSSASVSPSISSSVSSSESPSISSSISASISSSVSSSDSSSESSSPSPSSSESASESSSLSSSESSSASPSTSSSISSSASSSPSAPILEQGIDDVYESAPSLEIGNYDIPSMSISNE